MDGRGERHPERFGPDVTLDNPAYIDPTARVYGKVSIEEGASLWPYAVIRAENHHVTVGKFSNVQDHAMLHVSADGPTVIGDYCSIPITWFCAVRRLATIRSSASMRR